MSRKKIVVVEDEPDILEILGYNLRREGYEVHTAGSGSVALPLIRRELPDLVLLDLMLPGIDGVELCRLIKQDEETSQVLIIMVTAKGEESDIVNGLGAGADDYITKPFSPRELVARVQAVLRRVEGARKQKEMEVIACDGLVIDSRKHKVTFGQSDVPLTATEFRLLFFLAAHAGRVFSRDQLISNALGDGMVVVDRNIDVHVRAIRKKLGVDTAFIETIRGVGYRFRDIE